MKPRASITTSNYSTAVDKVDAHMGSIAVNINLKLNGDHAIRPTHITFYVYRVIEKMLDVKHKFEAEYPR